MEIWIYVFQKSCETLITVYSGRLFAIYILKILLSMVFWHGIKKPRLDFCMKTFIFVSTEWSKTEYTV